MLLAGVFVGDAAALRVHGHSLAGHTLPTMPARHGARAASPPRLYATAPDGDEGASPSDELRVRLKEVFDGDGCVDSLRAALANGDDGGGANFLQLARALQPLVGATLAPRVGELAQRQRGGPAVAKGRRRRSEISKSAPWS